MHMLQKEIVAGCRLQGQVVEYLLDVQVVAVGSAGSRCDLLNDLSEMLGARNRQPSRSVRSLVLVPSLRQISGGSQAFRRDDRPRVQNRGQAVRPGQPSGARPRDPPHPVVAAPAPAGSLDQPPFAASRWDSKSTERGPGSSSCRPRCKGAEGCVFARWHLRSASGVGGNRFPPHGIPDCRNRFRGFQVTPQSVVVVDPRFAVSDATIGTAAIAADVSIAGKAWARRSRWIRHRPDHRIRYARRRGQPGQARNAAPAVQSRPTRSC